MYFRVWVFFFFLKDEAVLAPQSQVRLRASLLAHSPCCPFAQQEMV